MIGDEEFGFDDRVIDSQAYRRVFYKQEKKQKLSTTSEVDEEKATGSSVPTKNGSQNQNASSDGEQELITFQLLKKCFAN